MEKLRMFNVIVPIQGKKALLYPPVIGSLALRNMATLHSRGVYSIAQTIANRITEQLTLEDMQELFD